MDLEEANESEGLAGGVNSNAVSDDSAMNDINENTSLRDTSSPSLENISEVPSTPGQFNDFEMSNSEKVMSMRDEDIQEERNIIGKQQETPILQPSEPQSFGLSSSIVSQASQMQTPSITESFVSSAQVNNFGTQPEVNRNSGKIKKIFTISAITLLSLGILGSGAYFGFYYYQRSSDLAILNKAEKNLLEISGAQVDFEMGTENITVGGKVLIDSDQDVKLDLGDYFNYFGNMDFMYIKEKDAFYVTDYNYEDNSKKEYIEYKNISQACEKYGVTKAFKDNVNITKEDLKYVVRKEDEKIDGINLYKYALKISEEEKGNLLKSMKDKAREVSGDDLGYDISLPKFTLTFWIDKSNLKMYKLEFNATVEIIYDENSYYYDEYMLEDNSGSGKITKDFDVMFGLKFNYNDQDNISLPDGANISETVDLLTIKEDMEAKESDAINKSLAHQIQNALEMYYVEYNFYPQTMEALKNTDPQLLSSDTDTSTLVYEPSDSGISYTLGFLLINQNDSGDNVIGEPPNKRYQVENKQ